jgi:hypothetical protein
MVSPLEGKVSVTPFGIQPATDEKNVLMAAMNDPPGVAYMTVTPPPTTGGPVQVTMPRSRLAMSVLISGG